MESAPKPGPTDLSSIIFNGAGKAPALNKTDKLAAEKSGLYFEYVKNNFYDQVRSIEKKIVNNC